MKSSNKSNQQPEKYELHRTLPSSSYQPAREATLPASSTPRTQPKIKRGLTRGKTFLLVLLLALSPFLFIAAWDIKNASSASQKMFGTSNVMGAFIPGGLDKDDNGRTNILLVGNSQDDPGHAGALLTDSIMVISLDKEEKTGYMLSVPRDLLVDIPEYGSAKINEAFQAGERQGFNDPSYPSGGIGLLEKVVSENLGVEIHNYIILDYQAVRGITDALGGITVNIESPDPRGIYDPNFKPEEGGPLKLANGPQVLDGQTALRLTRARGATYGAYGLPQSDFNRTQNQQKVFAAIKQEMGWSLILDPRVNEKFFDTMADNLQTDMEINEVLPIFRLLRSVPDSQMKPLTLRDFNKKNLLDSYRTKAGQSALVPAAGIDDFSDIQAEIDKISN